MQGRQCNWNDNENRVPFVKEPQHAASCTIISGGGLLLFVAFIGVKQTQLLVCGAYSSTGENNLCFTLILFYFGQQVTFWTEGEEERGLR